MGILYSGQTITDSNNLTNSLGNLNLDGSTAVTLITAVYNQLLVSGWTVYPSGSNTTPGVVPIRMRSVATPQGLRGDLWMQTNTVSGVTYAWFNASSCNATAYNTPQQTMTTQVMVTGSGISYRLISTGFYFYLLRAATPCPPGQSFMMHIPSVPAFLSGLVYESVVAVAGIATGSQITQGMFLTNGNNAYSQLNGSGGTGYNRWNLYGLGPAASADVGGQGPTMGSSGASLKPVWFDGSCEFYEPRVMSYQTNSSGASSGYTQAIGYLWDALVVNYPMPRGTAISYDGGTWLVLTESTDPGLMLKVA